MLLGTLLTSQSVKRFLDIVHQRLVVEILVALAIQVLQCLQFLDIAHADVGSQVEVEGRDSLTAVHLILGTLHRDTCQHRGRLDATGRTRSPMPGYKTTVKDMVQRMLHTGERLRGIIVLVMDMEVVPLYGVAALFREEVVVDKRLGGL